MIIIVTECDRPTLHEIRYDVLYWKFSPLKSHKLR